MKKFKKLGTIIFLSAYLILGISFVIPTTALAEEEIIFTPQIGIPGTDFQQGSNITVGSTTKNKLGETVMQSNLLSRYIGAFYSWGLTIVGVLAVLMLMAAGIIWLTSGGDSGKITNAKKMIEGSLLGTFLLLGSWLLLNTINPELTKMGSIETVVINKMTYCCDPVKGNVMMDKDGKCSSGSTCDNGSICSNTSVKAGEVSFSCLNKQNYGCCEWSLIDDFKELKCKAILKTESCPKASPTGYKYDTYYKEWCQDGVWRGSTKCTDRTPVCQGSEDAVTCVGTVVGYCYNEICWPGVKGKENQPCGNEANSKCDKDEKQDGKTCKGDSGGRDCESGLWCCKFNSDGTRVNK